MTMFLVSCLNPICSETPLAVKGSATLTPRHGRWLAVYDTLWLYCPARTTIVEDEVLMRKSVLLMRRVAASLLFMNLVVFPAYGQDAKQLYEQTCAMCHGASGKGDGPTSQVLQPKPANLTIALKDKTDAYLTKLLKGGGASVGKSPLMPSYKDSLSEEQLRRLIQYVKGFAAP
jgi:mono/diheme cytochrome c family protein